MAIANCGSAGRGKPIGSKGNTSTNATEIADVVVSAIVSGIKPIAGSEVYNKKPIEGEGVYNPVPKQVEQADKYKGDTITQQI